MTLAGRSDRRRRNAGTGLRWLAVGVAITVLVLLVDASLNSRSPSEVQSVSAGTWVDRALQVIGQSSADGQIVASLWTSGLHSPPSVVAGEIRQVAAQAEAEYRTVVALHPPAELAGSAGLLEACLLARSQAAAKLEAAVTSDLGAAAGASGSASTPADPATLVGDLTAAGSDMGVGDSAYGLFVSTFPPALGVRMPSSTWVTNPGVYQPQAAQVFLASLQGAASATPLHRVVIDSVTTSPPAESSAGGVAVLPDAHSMTVTIVIADTGNQAEKNLTVTAALSPSASGGSSSVRDFVDLVPGQAYTITNFGPLSPVFGQPSTLTISVTSASGGFAPVASTYSFQMPSPAPTTTTTTSTSAG